MKAPLYFVLLMLVGVFLASPATAQDDAAAEDTTAQDAIQTSDEAAQATEDAAQAADDAAQAADDAAQAADDAAQAADEAAQETDDVARETDEAAKKANEAMRAADDAVQMTQDSVTIEWIVNEAPDDAPVTLKGRLVEALGNDEYVFEHETGTIQVDIDDNLLNPDDFQIGLEVEIVGEVDKDEEEIVEVEVLSLNSV